MRTNVLNDLSNVVKKGTGLACSWSQVGRMSEGAPDEHPMSIRSASDGERWKPAGEKGSTRVWKHVAMIFAVLVMSMANIGMAWGGTPVTWTANSSDVSTLVGKSKVTVGSGTKTFDVWAVRAIVDASNTPAISYDGGVKFGGNALNKSGVAIYIPSTSDNIESIEFYLKTSNSRKTYYASGSSCPSSGTATGSALATSFTAYDFWSGGSYSKNYYYAIGGKTSGSGEVYIQKIVVTFADAAPSTKRIYMKAGEWNNDSPYFYAHSWGSSNSDVLMTLADCETDVYYADIPSGNTSVLFTRQSTNSGIKYKDQDGNWNQSADITISTNNKFTFSAWNGGDGKSTFTGGTYSAPTYTISFAANGGSGSMSSISSIACGDDQALPANTFTKSGYVFDGWKADVAVTIGGSSVAAGTKFAGGSTLQNITSNITLTAQWEENSCPESGTVYSASTSATGDISIAASASNLALNTATHKTTVTGGTMSVYNGQSSAKNLITANGFAMTNNNTYFRIDLDCPLETGDVISVDVGKNAEERGVWITTATSRPNSAPACALTATGTGSALATVTYTVTGSDAYHGNSTFYIYRATGNGTNFNNINITRSSACGATQPGEIGKGSLSNCSITLTAANSPAANNTWYWQSASDGTATNLGSGATKSVSTPGTYYIRSYFSTGSCWSDARSVTVTEGDLTPAAPTSLTAASTTAKGTTFTVTGAGTSNFEFYVSTESTAPVAGTGATYSAASTTKTIDDKVAGTTYYAWVRAVCGSYKSGWTALTGNTFTTSQVTVTHTLTNVTATSGATGANAAGGSDYTAVFAAVSGYSLPAPAITIDGNAAESGTDYTWTQGTGTVVIHANKITGNIVITIASAAAAPSSVAISGEWLKFAGETMTLTATPTGGNGPVTYQWYYGGKADGNAIEDATNATFSKTCAFSDAGSYYCKVTCGGSESTWGQNGDAYEVKVPHLYVKTGRNDGVKSDFGDVDFTRVDASTATASMTLGANWDYCYNIADGCGHYYGNAGTMQYNNYGPWVTNVNNQDCGLHTTNGATYVFTINYSNWSQLTTTVTFPSSNQAADKVIYFDNSERQWTNVYYRIGHTTHVQASAMDKVYGTANLYTFTTTEYNNFMGWHITNATGETGSNTNIYNTVNSPAITYATAHEGGAVTQSAVTVTPTTSRGTGSDTGINDNCTFYNYDITNGMKTDNVAITAPSNGTITVSYTDVNNAAQSFTSGNRDLAHTVILTSVTATPATGYDLSTLTISDGSPATPHAHTNGNSYTCFGATTIAATFALHNYNVTYSNPGNGNNYTIKVADGSATSASKTATMGQTITIVASPATGYDFTGWTITKAGGGTVEPVNASATTTTFTMPTDDVTITASFTLKTYTVNFAASPAEYGSVSPTSIASVNHGSTVSIASNVLTLKGTNVTATPTAAGADYTYAFSGWSVSNGAAITESQTITANFTRTANQYSVTHSLTSMTTGSGATGANAATYGTDYTATLNANSGYSRPASITVTAGATDITANCTWNQSTGAVTIPGSYITGNITITASGVVEVVLTALVANTLYEVPDMIPSGKSLSSSDQFFEGLSANTKFELIGSASGSTTPKVNNNSSNDKTIDGITFDDGSMWFKGNASLTSNIPTTFGLSFIVPEGGGKLYLYFSGTSTNIKLAKSGSSGSKPSCPNGYGEVDVTAGTYYLYGTGTTAPYCFYGLKLCSKYSVSITTTNVTKATGDATAVHGKAYTATFTANTGYTLPSDATVTIGGTPQTKGSGYTWTISAGTATLTIPAANVTGAISITVTGVAAESYSITYHCNGAESGCPSNVAATTNLPSPLPTGMTKDGYDFGGWFTDSECTVAAVAGAALTGNTDLYAKWTERGSGCDDTPHAWDVIATGAKSYKVRISKVTEEVAIPVADATASNLTAYAGSVSTNDNVTVQIADGGSSQYGYKFDGSNTYLKLVFSTPLVLNDTLVVSMTNASHNISFTTTAVRSTTLSTSGGKLIIPAALAGQSTLYLWRGSGSTMYLRSFAVKHECEAIPSCTPPTLPTATLSNQTVCEGSDIAAWDATPTNASTISGKSESVSYSWKKKGNDTELATTATFDLGASAAESQDGTYVVTVTVSKAGYASASASKEVDLTVTEGEEVTNITADKATVYPGNSVTLTATANITPDSWQWYTCNNAEGAGAAIISGAESASYTIASAGAAGTYYYKAVATGDCGTAERVYTLTVSEASGGDCETEFWFAKAADKPEGATAATHISGTPSGSSSASYTATIDGNNYTITGQTGQKTGNVTITVPEDYEGTLYVVVQGSSSRTITLSKGGVQVGQETPANSTWGTFTFSNLDAGTYTLVSSGNIGWGILALKLCSAVACSDPEVTASADNTTACVGTSVTFTAANAHASATYQWQKLDGTWTNISGSGATASTYNIPSVVAGDAGKYRVIATHDCSRTSNEVTLSVPSAPNFGSTVPASVSVMQTIALSINTVEATDAVKYRWYKSADATWDAGDVEIGTNKELIKAYDSEAIGSPSYYIFCRAQNACGITTSTAIAVNVTAYVEEDCATRGNEGDAQFGFEYSAGQATYNSTACWSMNDNSKKLIYAAPEGKYFKTMKVTIASSSASKASYNWSTNGGTDYTAVSLTVNSTLTERTIDVSAHGNVNALQIGRNFNSTGESSGTLYVSKICFEYTDACTATTVTPDESSKTYEMGGAWSNPTFTLTPAAVSGETLTYSSSNEDIASVDDDGTVTFNGDAGTVTITASYAGGTISATDYCASSGSYTITVSCTGGAPKVVPDGTVNMSGCNSSITLNAKKQDGTAFADGTYKWFRNGEEIDGATSSSYTATQAGTYTVERTNGTGCTTPSTNSAVVTSETTEPEVERLVPFQYYHVDKTYSDQMKMRHLFAVKNSGKLDGKSFKMYVSRSGGAATDVTSSNALEVWPSDDGPVDTVMVDLNKLSGKYSENDELVFTCKAIDCSGNVSDVYKETITMNVIGETPTLALICSGSSKAGGTRKTGELTVGGDFLTGYNVADLCEQTGSTSFDANTEWGLYTDLKTKYIVTPVNGYAVFNKLNYEPFDILLLTDYPKASKSDAAADVLDDMAALCDYRPMLSFKTHMVAKSPSKWAEKGFTTSPVVSKADGRLNLNIVCYAHPMFASLKTGENVYTDVGNTSAPLVYTMLSGTGFESSKGMQGFELAAAENFVTIGLTHYNATITKDSPETGEVTWTPGSEDRMLVTVAERQANPEARFILFSLNIGAHSKLTAKGEQVVLACLNYLLGTAEGTIEPADCSFTFDNGEGNERTPEQQATNCPSCPPAGDHKWNNPANWGPDYRLLPGEFTSVRIKKPVEVNDEHAHVMEVRIIDEGRIDIPANKALDVKSTIRRMDGSEIYPTEIGDIHIGSASTGNGTLIFNNDDGDTKARVDMYSNALADVANMSAATSTWQYIGTPHSDVASATHNYYDSWLYQYSGSGWEVIPNGGPLVPFRGYCVTHPDAPVVFGMEGTLVATTAQDIAIPAGYTVIANSWTAPIDINAITDDDMEGISDKTIYFFNTGNDVEGDNTTGTEAGTYRTTPIHSASYTGDWQIPSMQGFYISTTSAGTLHLDYDRHVRPTGSRSVVSNPMYAPRRAAAESNEPNVLKIFARGSRYQDKLVVLEREDFTRGYDSGWDGEAWGGGTLSPMVYVIGEGREDAVSAIPEFEGTVVAFKAGEDSEYRFEFTYSEDAEPLYLFDTENNTYTQIMTGESYYFSADDKAPHSRFILTRKAPQIATGVEPTSDGEGAKARKLLIEDKMYILLNGMLYDATGKVVK